MTDWNAVTEELLRTASSVDADVRFRSLVLQQQCESLQAICQYICDFEKSLAKKKTTQQAETVAVEQSIEDAIRHARQVRAKLVKKCDMNDEEKQTEPLGAKDQQLQSILAVAMATRTAQQSLETLEHKTEPVTKARVEYPRKLKALETQLEELHLKEKEKPTRFAFCCKMNEQLSLSPQRRQLILQQQQKFGSVGKMDAPVARIQTSFPKQLARLRGRYRLLMEFVLEKIEVKSPQFRQVADTPTFSSIFPIYHRLKQAKKMLRFLNSETRALLERLPPSPPKLSSATAAHRDAMLARIRSKKPRSDVGAIDNEALEIAAQKTQSHLYADKKMLEKLQTAWAARASLAASEDGQSHRLDDVYSATVREIILTELSNTVLWTFKTYIADTAEQPDASQVETVMRLVRLVDSVALSQGRTYRSVVAPHEPATSRGSPSQSR